MTRSEVMNGLRRAAKLMDGKVFKGSVGHQELAAWVEELEL